MQKVRSLKRGGGMGGGGSLKSEQKRTGRGGVLACVYVRLKKNADILVLQLFSSFPIDYNGSMKY